MTREERNGVIDEVLAVLARAEHQMKVAGRIVTIGGLIEAVEELRK